MADTPGSPRGAVVAVILGAGRGRRMGAGGSKAFLRLPSGQTCLETIAGTCAHAEVERVVVVLGGAPPAAGEIPDGVDVVINPEPERGMLSSLKAALDAEPLAQASGLLLWPVDCPRVPVSIVRALLGAAAEGARLAIPSHNQRRGHPAFFARDLFDALRAAPHREGARAVVKQHESDIVYVPTDEASVLEDLDRPEDLPV